MPPKPKDSARTEDGTVLVLSGWCITGHHTPSDTSFGCRRIFPSSQCSCSCHTD